MRLPALLALSALVLVTACGGGKSTADLTPSPSGQTLKNVPEWFLEVPNDPDHLFAAGTGISQDLQLANKKAEVDGLSQIAQQLDVRFNGLQKRFQEETGLASSSEYLDQFTLAYKTIIDQELYGTRVTRRDIQREGDIFRSYVLIEMPIGEANQRLMSKIKANENIYTRFRSTEAFKELEKEIEKYEAWKRAQGIR